MHPVLLDTLLAIMLVFASALVTWRVVWPKWRLLAKIIIHPMIYAMLSVYIGHWSLLVAFIHQVVFGLGTHILFCRKHGFTWYAVEDPERYAQLTKEWEIRLLRPRPSAVN
jgi:hypothetical protein